MLLFQKLLKELFGLSVLLSTGALFASNDLLSRQKMSVEQTTETIL
jgi:hypothetical protein